MTKNTILKLERTQFQISVWEELLKIPRGKTKTYKEIATAIGNPNSSRAVANACAQNPYAPDVPCHRVALSDAKEITFLFTKLLYAKQGG